MPRGPLPDWSRRRVPVSALRGDPRALIPAWDRRVWSAWCRARARGGPRRGGKGSRGRSPGRRCRTRASAPVRRGVICGKRLRAHAGVPCPWGPGRSPGSGFCLTCPNARPLFSPSPSRVQAPLDGGERGEEASVSARRPGRPPAVAGDPPAPREPLPGMLLLGKKYNSGTPWSPLFVSAVGGLKTLPQTAA